MVKRILRTKRLSAPQIPGFNAEASLYMSPAAYRSRGGSAGTLGAVRPHNPYLTGSWFACLFLALALAVPARSVPTEVC
jgi:hypothetical protein